MPKSNRQKGIERDFEIIQALKEWKTLNTWQIWLLFFNEAKLHAAQKRMRILTQRKKVKCGVEARGLPNYYYVDKRPDVEHWLKVNWIRIWLMRSTSWGSEKMTDLQCDDLITATYFNETWQTYRTVTVAFEEIKQPAEIEFDGNTVIERKTSVIIIDDQKLNKIVGGLTCGRY